VAQLPALWPSFGSMHPKGRPQWKYSCGHTTVYLREAFRKESGEKTPSLLTSKTLLLFKHTNQPELYLNEAK